MAPYVKAFNLVAGHEMAPLYEILNVPLISMSRLSTLHPTVSVCFSLSREKLDCQH